jgi:hypothetical protein
LKKHAHRSRWPSVTIPFVRDRLSFADLRLAARFLRRVPGHLRRPLTVNSAAAIVRERLARREAAFLELVMRTVYTDPQSPYRRLLDLAGCERGDMEQLVRTEGVEGTLHVLFRQGVYLTVDEFKGRRAARRGSSTIEVDVARLRNPLSALHVPTQSGGSGGTASPLVYDLASIRDQAANTLLALEAQGGSDWVKAVWGVSTGSAPVVLRFGSFGSPVARWFVHVSPAAPGIHPRYRWIPEGLRLAAATAGVGFPRPEVVSLADPLAIARWVVETRRGGGTPHLYGFTSPVVRLCEAALAAGLDFAGAQFTVTGESVTAARLAAIRASGAEAALDYGCAEAGGPVSYGCIRPTAPDDVHFCDDLHALIQPGPGAQHPEVPARAVLLSSLRMSAPVILLNVSLGDRAHVTRRRCGCPLEAHGWDTHLDTIRSFEKLTAGGMTFLDVDIAAVLEMDLPARFGGGPADYQLLEAERDDGGSGVVLRVHPRVGPLDEAVVRGAFLDAIGVGAGAERIMAAYWRAAGLPSIQRKPPLLSEKGKLLPVWRSGTAGAGHAAARQVVG